MKKTLAIILAAMLLIGCLTGCSSDEKTIVVGYTIYEPMNYFDENGKRKTAQIDINSTMIYNGYAHPYFTADDLKITGGQLIMISNDGDSDYDVVCYGNIRITLCRVFPTVCLLQEIYP